VSAAVIDTLLIKIKELKDGIYVFQESIDNAQFSIDEAETQIEELEAAIRVLRGTDEGETG
jgi:peptidoglycan hydrolase CwlO-like protein